MISNNADMVREALNIYFDSGTYQDFAVDFEEMLKDIESMNFENLKKELIKFLKSQIEVEQHENS